MSQATGRLPKAQIWSQGSRKVEKRETARNSLELVENARVPPTPQKGLKDLNNYKLHLLGPLPTMGPTWQNQKVKRLALGK